jgi:hypothetical protein
MLNKKSVKTIITISYNDHNFNYADLLNNKKITKNNMATINTNIDNINNNIDNNKDDNKDDNNKDNNKDNNIIDNNKDNNKDNNNNIDNNKDNNNIGDNKDNNIGDNLQDNISNIIDNNIEIKQYNINNSLDIDNTIFNSDNLAELSQSDKKLLREKVKFLSKNEYKIIFSMIYSNNIKYTENNNGIFINLDNIDNGTLIKINTYVNKISENKLKNDNIIVKDESCQLILNSYNKSNIKLSNYEKSIIKRTNYIEEQKNFKNNNWFVKKKATDS